MKKVIVIGCPGSGKTTFAEKLHKFTGLPLYHLDAIWHKPDKTHIPREEFDKRASEIFAAPEWIIDGNYNRTIETRLQNCDTVFLFDLPTQICLQGATQRLGKGRYDLPWIDTELDPVLKQTILDFPHNSLPVIYELINKYKAEKQVVIFKSREDTEVYLDRLKKSFLQDIRFEYLDKSDFIFVSRIIFSILADNMSKISPTGNTAEEDYKIWLDAVGDGLQREERQIILIKDKDDIVGFFQYYTNDEKFMMEEIQLKPEYHGKGILRKLYGFVLGRIRTDIRFVEAYASTSNEKSIAILERFGMQNIGLNKNGRSYHFKGRLTDLKEWYENENREYM